MRVSASVVVDANSNLANPSNAMFACVGCGYANAGPGQFVTFRQIDVTGRERIEWDGADGSATSFNPTGLNHVDLTSGGVRNALLVRIAYHNMGVRSALVTVYTDGAHASSRSFNMPAPMNGPSPVNMVLPFDTFSLAVGAGASFADVGAVTLTFDATGGGWVLYRGRGRLRRSHRLGYRP